jgi:cytochrome c553
MPATRRTLHARLRRLAIAAAAALALVGAANASPGQDYMLYCMGCHGAQAQGVAGRIPPLANALGRYMRSPVGRDYVLRVPGAANSVLSDAQLAAVLNWVALQFSGADLSADVAWFSAEEVTRSRHTPLADVRGTRREVVRTLAASGTAPAADY